jgi:phospholipase C
VYKPRQKRITAALALSAMLAGQLQAIPHAYATDDDRDDDRGSPSSDEGKFRTATPIEHLIVVIPENRSYDHTYGT